MLASTASNVAAAGREFLLWSRSTAAGITGICMTTVVVRKVVGSWQVDCDGDAVYASFSERAAIDHALEFASRRARTTKSRVVVLHFERVTTQFAVFDFSEMAELT